MPRLFIREEIQLGLAHSLVSEQVSPDEKTAMLSAFLCALLFVI